MPRFPIRLVRFALLVVLLALAFQTAAEACPTCKESLAQNDPAHANVVRGYFWSILFMMSMPYLILGSLGAMFWWQVRKAKMQKLHAAALTAPEVSPECDPHEVAEPAVAEERELVEV